MSAATFYSVSISKPIPVWFGKKFKILTTRFPNQFQFGLEKNYNFDDSFSKPIPVWFGKNDHISEAKNSKLIIIWTKESWFPADADVTLFDEQVDGCTMRARMSARGSARCCIER